MTSNSGVYHGKLAVAPSLALGRLVAKNVEVLVADAVPAEVDGLLGLSFIARFTMEVVPRKLIVLSPRSRFSFGS